MGLVGSDEGKQAAQSRGRVLQFQIYGEYELAGFENSVDLVLGEAGLCEFQIEGLEYRLVGGDSAEQLRFALDFIA